MRKIIPAMMASIAILGVILFLLTMDKTAKDVSLEDYSREFEAQYITAASKLTEGDFLRTKRAFGINSKDYDECLYYYSTDMMSSSELLIIKLKDISQKEEVISAINNRIAAQKESFDGYGSDQLEFLNAAIVYETDKYVFYAVSADNSLWLKSFKNIIWE